MGPNPFLLWTAMEKGQGQGQGQGLVKGHILLLEVYEYYLYYVYERYL